MDEEYLLGIDVGTSGSSGVIVDSEVNTVVSASTEHDVLVPKPGWVEHDADEMWWDDVVELATELLDRSGVPPEKIAGIGISALHAAMLPVDRRGEPLRPAILYGVDTRTSEEIEILNDRIGAERIYDVCGNKLTFQSVGPKILWYKRNEPELFERTDKILDATGYVVSRLTGNYTMDNAIAGYFHPLYDPTALDWDDEMIDAVGIPHDLLPETQWSTEIAGHVTESAASATGLAEGTPVVVGTGDAIASLVSVGAVDDGDSIFMYGTTGVIFTTLENERRPEGLWSFPHCLEGKYTAAGGMATSGAILKWFRDEFAFEEQQRANGATAYELLDDRAAEIDPGSDGLVLLPYFSGERTPITDDSARGTITGLTLSHTKEHVYRATLEGVGYGFRHHLEAMRDEGVPVDRVRAIGGGARSELWRDIVSDITGVTQEYVADPLGSPLGGAYLAGLGTDVFDDLEPLRESITVNERTEPDPESTALYDEYYDVYRDLYPQLKDSMHRLSELGSR
ncbi:FGGY-family carbohydrate kinase [Natrarchaeobius oligotrophus]|nr:FGGY-family carbohydrate kinase [Natrarchaeobius chitinivorans]